MSRAGVWLSLVLASCGPTVGATGDDRDADASADSGPMASSMIGAGGGMVSVGGASILIPPGALARDTMITIAVSSEAPPAGTTAYSPVFVFGPDGTTFAMPVTVSLTNDGANSDAVVYWSRASGEGFDALETTNNGATVLAQVTHFSRGFVGRRGGSMGGDGGATDASVDGGSGGDAGSDDASVDGGPADATRDGGTTVDAGGPTDGGPVDAGGPTDGGSGGCSMAICSGSSGAGGTPMCGCSQTCGTTRIEVECDGTTCTCLRDGVEGTTFAQGSLCGTPGLIARCGGSTGTDGGVSVDGGGPTDGGVVDAGGGTDGGVVVDGGAVDAGGPVDAGGGTDGGVSVDGGAVDAGRDTGVPPVDGGISDAGPADTGGGTCSIPMCSGSSGAAGAMCMCSLSCGRDVVSMECTGTECICRRNGLETRRFAQGGVCRASGTPPEFYSMCGG